MASKKDRTEDAAAKAVDRRGFIRGGAVALGGAAALARLGSDGVSAQGIKWDREADVVVIGSGGAGLPAAIAARDQGVSVIVVEQNFDVGGMAINSGALVQHGCGNAYQKAAGLDDSPDRFYKDWTQRDHPLTRYSDRELVRKFADEAVPTFNFLTENGVKWLRLGVSHGVRSVARQVVAAPWPVLAEVPTRSDNGGSGLVRSLEKSAKAKGVVFLMQHKMTEIHRESRTSGRITGITTIEVDKLLNPLGRTVRIRARKGVIITTGGHMGNVNFRRMFDPRLTEEYSAHCGLCNPRTADGELAAMSIGAALWTLQLQVNEQNAQMQEGTSIGTYFNGGARFPPESEHFIRAKAVGLIVKDYQDLILVKENGKRFWYETMTDEDERKKAAEAGVTPYRPVRYYAAAMDWTGDPKKLNGGGPIWAIFDSDAVKREGWKVEPPYVEPKYFFRADTIEELAAKIKECPHQWRAMPPEVLRATVDRYNSFVDSGKDLDFKKPRPLHKIQTPPFYAAWDTPNPNDCYSGLRINTNAQVIDMKGDPIPGLYAAGDSASGIGIHGLGKATLFGRLAGMHAAKLKA
jgi:hypothetical protein